MSKIIKLEFNSLGVLVNTETDEIRQGDKGVVVNAYFEGKSNANYTARLNLTRSDEKQISDVLMTPSTSESTLFSKKLDSLWYFAKSGETTLTVFLSDANGVIANGQVVIAVEKTDYSEDPTITPDQYATLLQLITSKLNITSGIMTSQTRDDLGDYDQYELGQVFYIKSDENKNDHHTLLQLVKIGNLKAMNVLFDFDDIKSGRIVDCEVEQVITATKITNTVKLLNDLGEEVASFEIELPSATNEKAGLMSASDKTKLSALPTASQIEQQHTNLHNEVVAEKNRAEDIETQKENLSNKKTIINDSTANDTNYASVKAVRDFVNDAINNVSAYYITKNATGDAFDSVAQLTNATVFYSGGQVRTPTRNDYCIVRVDENHNNATTRYTYQNSQWEFQYVVNEEPFTDAQLQAINSGITSAKVNAYDEHIVNTDKHIQSGERTKWNEVENKQIKNKTFNHIPTADELEEGQVGIIPSIEDLDGETIIGEGLEVITDAQGNKTLKTNLSAVAYSNDYEDLDNKPFTSIGGGLEVSNTGRLQSSKHLYKYSLEVYLKTSDGEERVTAIAVGTDINTTFFNEFVLMSDLQLGLLFNFALLMNSSFAPAKLGLYGGKVYLSYIKEKIIADVYGHELVTRQITRIGTVTKSEIF